jgi:hypothetical protein
MIDREVACQKFDGLFSFRRARAPHIDTHGFESYSFFCKWCGAFHAAIVDPFDEALLLTVVGNLL